MAVCLTNEMASATEITPTAQGAHELTFSVGAIRVALASDVPGMQMALPKEVEHFLVRGGDADARVRISWGDLSEPPAGEQIFDAGGLWQLYRQQERYVFRFTSPAFGVHCYRQASFNQDFTSGEVVLHSDYFDRGKPVPPLECPLDEVLFTNLLARGRGVEVHACGVQDSDGRGYLFLGESGAGKTTTARLWEKDPDVLVLSDDRIILRFLEGKLWMYGTPWHGEAELAASARTELKYAFFLGRGGNEIIPLAPLSAASRFFACSFVPFYNVAGLDFTLEFLEQVTRVTPSAELRFVPDERVIEFVRENAR